jgi:hypothetical protein
MRLDKRFYTAGDYYWNVVGHSLSGECKESPAHVSDHMELLQLSSFCGALALPAVSTCQSDFCMHGAWYAHYGNDCCCMYVVSPIS